MKYVATAMLLIFVMSCTRTFFLVNDSNNKHSIKILYENYKNSNNILERFTKDQKRGTIENVMESKAGNYYYIEFVLNPKKYLPITSILRVENPNDVNKEKRIVLNYKRWDTISTFYWDTILCTQGEKIKCNKFVLSSKFFSIFGKSNYVYELKD